MPNRKLRVFLCHASQDKPIVRELYQRLLAEGWIDPWLDEEKLLPGQDWDLEIEKAVEAADAVIVCVSTRSVTKEGYVQREIRKVLDIALEKPEETIFIIPLRLDDCELPRRLRTWHYVDHFPAEQRKRAYPRLLQSLRVRYEQLLPKENESEEAQLSLPESPVRVDEEKPSLAQTMLNRATEIPPQAASGKIDMVGSALLILFFILASFYSFGYTDTDLALMLGSSAVLSGVYFLVSRQVFVNIAIKISTILFLATYVLWIYGNYTGWESSPFLSIISGIASAIAMGSLLLKFRSDRKPAPYFAICFAIFLFLAGAKLIINAFNYHPNEIQTPIIVTGIAAAILLWLEL